MIRIMRIVILLLFLKFNLFSQLDSFSVNGHMRSYLVHAPTNISNPPLVICLHGAKGDPLYQQNITQFDLIADREKFIVVYPDGHYTNGSHNWDYSSDEDVNFLLALIDTMYKRYNIDLSRVYCCGFSLGGMMTYRMACSSADKLAAVVSVSGPLSNSNCTPSRPIPLMHIHGLADNTINYSNAVSTVNTWRELEGCTVEPQTIDPYPSSNPSSPVRYERWGSCNENSEIILLSVDECDHSCPTMEKFGFNATEEIWNFFKRHSLDKKNKILLHHPKRDKLNGATVTSELIIPLDALKIKLFDIRGIIIDKYKYQNSIIQKKIVKNGGHRKVNGIFILQIVNTDGELSTQKIMSIFR